MQELEPYGAASSHNISWSRKVMRLRQLQLRSYVQQKKNMFQNCTKSSAAALCLRGTQLPALQHLFILNRSILNISFGAGAAFLYGSGCS
jgi:hypothetical protein